MNTQTDRDILSTLNLWTIQQEQVRSREAYKIENNDFIPH